MENFNQTNGLWQDSFVPAVVSLVPASAASYDATAAPFAAAFDATTGVLGQPKTMRTHKSITRPGNPPRGRHR